MLRELAGSVLGSRLAGTDLATGIEFWADYELTDQAGDILFITSNADSEFAQPLCLLGHQRVDFFEVPRAEIVSVNADIHGKRSRCVREVPVRMSVQVPRSMMGAIPDPHCIVTDHDGLAMYGDFRKVAEPRKLLGHLANLFVVIARHRKDLLAANLLAMLQSSHLAPDAEISKEIENVIGLNRGVETVEDRLIHFLDASKRSITVTDYVACLLYTSRCV